MKKLILALIMLVTMSTVAFASGRTTDSEAIAFRNRIQNCVRNEGYSPTIEDDGDIKFKKEGTAYWISVEPYKNGYYVKVYSGTTSDSSMYNCLYSANAVMCDYKFLQINTHDGDNSRIFILTYDWYCTTLSQFEQMFPSAMSVVSSALSDLEKLID